MGRPGRCGSCTTPSCGGDVGTGGLGVHQQAGERLELGSDESGALQPCGRRGLVVAYEVGAAGERGGH